MSVTVKIFFLFLSENENSVLLKTEKLLRKTENNT